MPQDRQPVTYRRRQFVDTAIDVISGDLSQNYAPPGTGSVPSATPASRPSCADDEAKLSYFPRLLGRR